MHLLMVGDGDQKPQARELIRKLGLNNKVTLEPFRKDVPDVLAAADIFVLPSLWEGLPDGLAGSNGNGKSSDRIKCGWHKRGDKNNENGLLIETDNLEENLTDALLYIKQG